MDESSSILNGNVEAKTSILSLLRRIPWKIIVLVAFIAIATYFSVKSLTSPTESPNRSSDSDPLEASDELTFTGNEGDQSSWFPPPNPNLSSPYFPTVTTPNQIKKLLISNALINSSSFTQWAQPFQNLESIYMSNVTLFGDLGRVYLPQLKDFRLEIALHPGEEVAQYKTKDKLKSLLFFDKTVTTTSTWDLLTEVSTLGVNIELIADGSRVIVTHVGKQEVVLTMNYCDEILRNIKWPFTTLTLGNCTVASTSIPSSVTHIVLGNVGFSSGATLPQIVRSLTRLEEFFGSIPNLSIDLGDFSKTLKFLCLSGISLKVPPGVSAPNVHEVSLGGNVLDLGVANNFEKIFPNVETVGVFGIPTYSYELLESLSKTKASTIIMEYFQQNVKGSVNSTRVQKYLEERGVPKGSANFMLSLPEGSDLAYRMGMTLTEEQSNFFRYTLMGWYKIDTYEKYLRVLEEGRKYMEALKNNKDYYIGGVGGEIWPLVVPSK